MACEACNTIPPVEAGEYSLKGSYETVGGLKTYVTGPTTASTGLVSMYDIFGLASQTLQGADLLSAALNAIVIVPDFFEDNCAKAHWFSGDANEEDEKTKGELMASAMNFGNWTPTVDTVMQDAKAKWGSVKSWGSYGLCWGGKITVLKSGPNTHFKASGQVHPGRLAVEDALALQIPHIVLASNGEDAGVVAEYAKALVGEGKPNVVETYGDMHHGWMGARADLKNENNLKEYERGYNQLAAFFGKNL